MMNISTIIVLLLLTSFASPLRYANGAGIFELELTKLVIDNANLLTNNADNNNNNKLSSTTPTTFDNSNNNATVRNFKLIVCLKEAFASNLAQPCTFGSANISLATIASNSQTLSQSNLTSTIIQNASIESNNGTITSNAINKANVRIAFSFRWTKSFTVIVSVVEELPAASSNMRLVGKQSSPTADLVSFKQTTATRLLPYDKQTTTTVNETLPAPTATVSGAVSIRLLNNNDATSSGGVNSNGDDNNIDVGKSIINETTNSSELTKTQSLNYLNQTNAPILTLIKYELDKHVATESEIQSTPYINADNNNNNNNNSGGNSWRLRESRGLRSLLAYKFRVQCSQHYYGDGCTQYCKPRNDLFGHYTCHQLTGAKLCSANYTGSECAQIKCKPTCNLRNAHCDESTGSCVCRNGWTGEHCDKCVVHPGCANGYCVSPWQCVCNQNWGGVLCDRDLNVCATLQQPCKNNGTCENIEPDKFRCQCARGFAGADCSLVLPPVQLPTKFEDTQTLSSGCAHNPCANGGTCLSLVDANPLNPLEQQHHAHQHQQPSSDYKCVCALGWTGDNCSTSAWLEIQANVSNNATATQNEHYLSSNQMVPPPNAGHQTVAARNLRRQAIQIDFKHLMSGVMLASALGVVVAILLLSWGCLVMIESSKLSVIQMKIVKRRSKHSTESEADYDDEDDVSVDCQQLKSMRQQQQTTRNSMPHVTLTIRNVRDRIRNSFRLNTKTRPYSDIKPNTRFNIDSVIRAQQAPPKYSGPPHPKLLEQIIKHQDQEQHQHNQQQMQEYQQCQSMNADSSQQTIQALSAFHNQTITQKSIEQRFHSQYQQLHKNNNLLGYCRYHASSRNLQPPDTMS